MSEETTEKEKRSLGDIMLTAEIGGPNESAVLTLLPEVYPTTAAALAAAKERVMAEVREHGPSTGPRIFRVIRMVKRARLVPTVTVEVEE